MRAPREVEVPVSDIKPGDKFKGYTYSIVGRNGEPGKGHCFSEIIIDENGTPLSWGTTPIDKEVIHFLRPMTWQEEEEWYRQQTTDLTPRDQLNLIGIHTDLYGIADARHEMWNGWIETTWEEQVVRLRDEDFFIVGIADPAPARMGMPMRHPVAVVIEYSDGDRYWCHAEKDWFDDMREESLDKYRKLMGE